MNEIKIAENKNVTFRNVLSRRLDSTDSGALEKSARMFQSYIERQKLKPYGPLILRNTARLLGRADMIDSEMLAQLRERPDRIAEPYSFEETVRMEGCLMARFTGNLSDIEMATAKMRIYAFERGKKLGAVTYIVITPAEGDTVTADIFTEMLRWWDWGNTSCRSSATAGYITCATRPDSYQ